MKSAAWDALDSMPSMLQLCGGFRSGWGSAHREASVSSGSSIVVNRKWPRWFTASCSSNPSLDLSSGQAIIPAHPAAPQSHVTACCAKELAIWRPAFVASLPPGMPALRAAACTKARPHGKDRCKNSSKSQQSEVWGRGRHLWWAVSPETGSKRRDLLAWDSKGRACARLRCSRGPKAAARRQGISGLGCARFPARPGPAALPPP